MTRVRVSVGRWLEHTDARALETLVENGAESFWDEEAEEPYGEGGDTDGRDAAPGADGSGGEEGGEWASQQLDGADAGEREAGEGQGAAVSAGAGQDGERARRRL